MREKLTFDALTKWITWLPFALPLLYTYPLTGSFKNELLRSSLVIFAGFIAAYKIFTDKLYKQIQKRLLGILILLMLASLLGSEDPVKSLVGRNGDYQGLLLQLAALAVAVLASFRWRSWQYWREVTVIMQVVCAISLVVYLPYVTDGYRLAGLVLHDTGMGLYAAIAAGLTILTTPKSATTYRRYLHWILVCALVLAVMLSASRIALLLLGLEAIIYALFLPRLRKLLTVFIIITIAMFLFSVIFIKAADRLHDSNKISEGFSYRQTLYTWSLRHADLNFLGKGSVDIKNTLRPEKEDKVPAVLKDTLYYGYPLWYSHSQWIDLLIAYGVLGLGIFAYLFAYAAIRLSQLLRQTPANDRQQLLAATTIVLAIGLHLTFNTPSIELWPMVWLAICLPLIGVRLKKRRPPGV